MQNEKPNTSDVEVLPKVPPPPQYSPVTSPNATEKAINWSWPWQSIHVGRRHHIWRYVLPICQSLFSLEFYKAARETDR